jgi:hypothetical protein
VIRRLQPARSGYRRSVFQSILTLLHTGVRSLTCDRLLKTGQFADIKIRATKTKFVKAHKSVLAGKSHFFATLFEDNPQVSANLMKTDSALHADAK